jgi:CRISPR/Cas system CSM-associated protein Csm3 (group 7 of RAMP superfamily)
MLQQTLNELRATIEIRPQSPLLVKDGRHHEAGNKERLFFHHGVERTPKAPRKRKSREFGSYDSPEDSFDMAFISTRGADGRDLFYIPGSSLRGVVRGAAERIVGRWRPDLARQGDPFLANERWIHDARERSRGPKSSEIYAAAGPIERSFGHTALRGRWVFSDAPMRDERQAGVMVRDGVGINRRTGAAAEDIKFTFETITGGVFVAELVITNYELWQLGLLAHTLAALDGGSARLGYGTRRGLGRVELHVRDLRWRWYPKKYREPTFENGMARIPPISELVAQIDLPADYVWRDDFRTDLVPRVPLTATASTAEFVPTWASPLANAGNPWIQPPWPQFGPLLPAALAVDHWPVTQEVAR